jgi:hypothetical protein
MRCKFYTKVLKCREDVVACGALVIVYIMYKLAYY